MTGIRISAGVVSSLDGRYNDSGNTNVPQVQGNNNVPTLSRQEKFGNKCGHNKHNPQIFNPPSRHKKRPYAIEEAKRRSAESYFYPLKFDLRKASFHADKKTKIGGLRKIRSEKRHIILNHLMVFIFHYTCLKTMQLGFIDGKTGKFIKYSQQFLIKEIQRSLIESGTLETASDKRIKTAMAELKDLGYIEIKQNKEKRIDGTYRSLPSDILVNPKLFYDLGISENEIIFSKKAEVSEFERYLTQTKSYQYKKNQRFQTKQQKETYKKERSNIQDILKRSKQQNISQEEKAILEREMPGHDRTTNQSPAYRDFTGISQNREEVLKRNGISNGKDQSMSPLAQYWLNQFQQLKKPPS